MTDRPKDYEEHLEGLGAVWGTRRDERVVQEFDDPDVAYWSVRRDGAGLADRSERETLVVRGGDTIKWLQGLITSDLMDLVEEGSGLWSCAPNANGRMVADMRILHLPEMLMMDLEPGTLEGGFMGYLRQNIIMEDIQISDRSEATGRIGVHGPRAAAVLEAAGKWESELAALEDYDGTWGSLGGIEVVVQMTPLSGGPGYELFFDRDSSLRVWEALESAGGDDLEPAGDETLETLRIEAGVPRFGVETDKNIIPLEANLGKLVAFDKGCYVGQEIIARLDTLGTPAKRLRTLVFDGGAAPAPGAEASFEGRNAGTVASSTWSPLLEAPIALAYIKRNFNDVGERVEVEGRLARIEEAGYPLEQAATAPSEAAS